MQAYVIGILSAGAVGGSTAFVPEAWVPVTTVCATALIGVVLVLAIRRSATKPRTDGYRTDGCGRVTSKGRPDPTVMMAMIMVAVGSWVPLLPDIWTVLVVAFVMPVLCVVGLVFAIRRYQRQVAVSPHEA